MKPRTATLAAVLSCATFTLASAAAELVPSPNALRSFGPIHPRIAPDGSRIAVSYQGAICTLPANGGALTRLTSAPGWDVEPAWSPDSQRIAFMNAGNLTAGELLIVNAADGRRLASPPGVRAQGPLWWHPDGRRILGRFAKTGAPVGPAWCDVASGEITRITGIPDNWAMRVRGSFALSPDSGQVVFAEHQDREGEQTGNNGPQANLWRVSSAGGEPEKLCQWPSRIHGICFTATGRGVYLVTDRGGAEHVDGHFATARKVDQAIARGDYVHATP
jgi:Tol biopolymer transport system component